MLHCHAISVLNAVLSLAEYTSSPLHCLFAYFQALVVLTELPDGRVRGTAPLSATPDTSPRRRPDARYHGLGGVLTSMIVYISIHTAIICSDLHSLMYVKLTRGGVSEERSSRAGLAFAHIGLCMIGIIEHVILTLHIVILTICSCMQCGEQEIGRLRQRPEYSPVFNLCLNYNTTSDTLPQGMVQYA